MIKKFELFFKTIRYLKIRQIFYRIFYTLCCSRGKSIYTSDSFKIRDIYFQESISSYQTYLGDYTFKFLNITHQFTDRIDWDFSEWGMLWAYNLNYFEYLLQDDLDTQEGIRLIDDFILNKDQLSVRTAPYPISLRNIFWIRFFVKNSIKNQKYDEYMFASYKLLMKRLEYHLLGNHLLENAYSLLFGAYYFNNETFYAKANKLLKEQLREQVLDDGAHFELSPMYHQILLYRLLDCINLVSNNPWHNDDLEDFLKGKAQIMLSWLSQMTFKSGEIPHLNDSTNGIAPSTKLILEYAERLLLKLSHVPLSDSYYRVFQKPNFKCIFDIGGINPSYQPGHAHADTFNVVLDIRDKSIFIDTGCSTYEPNNVRQNERGTISHNTVIINEQDSSEVWASHRVGNRAKVQIIQDKENFAEAKHFGYKKWGAVHKRSILAEEAKIVIVDTILKQKPSVISDKALFHLDFNASQSVLLEGNMVSVVGYCSIVFDGAQNVKIIPYSQAIGFNKYVESNYIEVSFVDKLETLIDIL